MKVSDSISFQSNIKFIDYKVFQEKIASLNPKRHEVGWPWTADTMKKGKNLFTTGIMNCIAGGIVDGGNVTIFHLGIYKRAQAKAKRQKGFSIENFKRRILEKINLENENLHGIILGGFQLEPNDKYNVNILNKIRKFFEEQNIPYTIFGARKDVHYFGRYGLFFSSKEDTWYITNSLCGNKSSNGIGKEIEVFPDSVEYNTYEKQKSKVRTIYNRVRKKTDVFDFFRSQFRQVSVSKFDKLV